MLKENHQLMRTRLLFRLSLLFTGILCYSSLSAQTPASSTEFAQRPVVLYSQPDRNSPVIGTATFTDELRHQSKPVANTPAEEFWFSTERPTSVSGYVRNRDLGKDLNIKEGSPIRRTANPESDILFHWEKGNVANFGDVSGHFTQVSTERPVTIYYQALPPPVSRPAAQPASATTPQTPPPPARINPATPKTAPEPKGDGQPIAPPVTSYRLLTELPENPERTLYFVGTFRPYRSIIQVRRSYRFELIGSDNQRIAFVDMDKVTSAQTLNRYFHKKVLISGTLQKIAHTDDYLIEARLIRSREN